jgi:hypothetical protein
MTSFAAFSFAIPYRYTIPHLTITANLEMVSRYENDLYTQIFFTIHRDNHPNE